VSMDFSLGVLFSDDSLDSDALRIQFVFSATEDSSLLRGICLHCRRKYSSVDSESIDGIFVDWSI
jgi:hypothetical protein